MVLKKKRNSLRNTLNQTWKKTWKIIMKKGLTTMAEEVEQIMLGRIEEFWALTSIQTQATVEVALFLGFGLMQEPKTLLSSPA